MTIFFKTSLKVLHIDFTGFYLANGRYLYITGTTLQLQLCKKILLQVVAIVFIKYLQFNRAKQRLN